MPNNNFCPVHDAVNLPGENIPQVFFGMRGTEVIDSSQNAVCTCNQVHTPVITILSTTPLKIDLQDAPTNFK